MKRLHRKPSYAKNARKGRNKGTHMALPVKDQLRYWGVVSAVIVLLLWALGDVLLPFVIGGAIAYFLDPVADRLERLGLSRMAATAIITVVGVLGFVLMILMVVPALITQLLDLRQKNEY